MLRTALLVRLTTGNLGLSSILTAVAVGLAIVDGTGDREVERNLTGPFVRLRLRLALPARLALAADMEVGATVVQCAGFEKR